MKRANISGAHIFYIEEFRDIAAYLDGQGFFAEVGDEYGLFVVTPEGIEEAARY